MTDQFDPTKGRAPFDDPVTGDQSLPDESQPRQPGADVAASQAANAGTAPGLPGRAEIIERYARLCGRDVSNVPYWVAFSKWRSACINAGVQARYLAGHMADDGYLQEARVRAEQGARLGVAARDALRTLGI